VKRWKDVDKKTCTRASTRKRWAQAASLDRDLAEMSLRGRNVKPFDRTGGPTAGWVMVEEAGWKTAAGLSKWQGIGKDFALSLPEKKGKAKKKKTLREYKQ
jgi:hypothetical protein